MRNILFGLAAILFVEGSAQACACLGPKGEQQKREWAQEIARDAIALVEVEQVESMNVAAMRPELYRVTKVLFGKAPRTFRLYRRFTRGKIVTIGIDDCDASPASGERKIVVLRDPRNLEAKLRYYPVRERAKVPRGDYDIGSMCERLFLDHDDGVRLVVGAAGKLGRLKT